MSTWVCLIPKFKEPLGSLRPVWRTSLLGAFSGPLERLARWELPSLPCLQGLLKEWRTRPKMRLTSPPHFFHRTLGSNLLRFPSRPFRAEREAFLPLWDPLPLIWFSWILFQDQQLLLFLQLLSPCGRTILQRRQTLRRTQERSPFQFSCWTIKSAA